MIGNSLQAIGNTTIIYSILAGLPENKELNLVIKGNLLQALGGSTGVLKITRANLRC